MSIIGRTALRATRVLRAAGVTAGETSEAGQAAREQSKQNVFKKGARNDPELYVGLTILGEPRTAVSSIRSTSSHNSGASVF